MENRFWTVTYRNRDNDQRITAAVFAADQRQAQEIYHQPFADYSPRNGRVSLMKPGGDGEAAAVEYAEKVSVVGL